MGKGTENMLQDPIWAAIDSKDAEHNKHWVIMEGDDDICDSTSTTSSFEGLTASNSSSSSDLMEDASSIPYSSASSLVSSGPLYELSELMAQLPIKRGLSQYFQGKSRSFTSLSSVRSIEDLAKRENPYRKKIESYKTFAGSLHPHKAYSPKATISKKASGGSFSSLLHKRGSFLNSCRLPSPLQKN